MDSTALNALSPLDGRYAEKADPIREFLSEYALIRYRVLVEVRWLEHLANEPAIAELPPLEAPVKDLLNRIVDSFSLEDARRVKALEKTTNHDVKAVEYFLREKLEGVTSRGNSLISFLHFACTSEDINNLAYALMLRDLRKSVLLPALRTLEADLRKLANTFAAVPMLSRTHGQTASPTTLGKEVANFVARIARQSALFENVEIFGKINGAVGNFNAHVVAYPDCDWVEIAARFVRALGLSPKRYTTQIEPHDWIAEYCQALERINTVTIDLCRDFWSYISIGYFKSRPVPGEVGSSTMPHKVNPIDFENAEGNLGMANAMLGHLAGKLPVSRWQRDLTDSTVLRNLGPATAYGFIAWQSCRRGLDKLDADPERIARDLEQSPEVLAEAVQTVLRKHGVADAYEQLKELTRGRQIDADTIRELVAHAPLSDADRKRLSELEPAQYIGLAAELARQI
ncbi:MAG TPA: adenylosuccinate lyase [Gammaproteobacteria bacterium]